MFSYTTTKKVRIHDPYLVSIYMSLLLGVISYVLVFEILYSNGSFEHVPVRGQTRLSMRQPTRDNCDPLTPGCDDDLRRVADLSYCSPGGGPTALLARVHRGTEIPTVYHHKLSHHAAERSAAEASALALSSKSADGPLQKRPCDYLDGYDLSPEGMLDESLFVPTQVQTHSEESQCPAGSSECGTMWKVGPIIRDAFVADIERFAVVVSAAFNEATGAEGSLQQVPGYIPMCAEAGGDRPDSYKERILRAARGECAEKISVPLSCGTGQQCLFASSTDVDDKRRDRAAEMLQESRAAFSVAGGDFLTIDTLLALAGISSLDDEVPRTSDVVVSSEPNEKRPTYRETGVVLDISIKFHDLIPFWSSFGYRHVEYEYAASARRVSAVAEQRLPWAQPSDYPANRHVAVRHGVLVRATIAGNFGRFSILNFMVMLTTSVALLASVRAVIDFLALYVLKDKSDYDKAIHHDIERSTTEGGEAAEPLLDKQ